MRIWIYIVMGIIVLLLVLIWTGKKSVHHEIIINAAPSTVWNVLIQTENYPDWNPVMRLLEGEVKEGNKVKYRFTQDQKNISEIGASVERIVPNELLKQRGGIPLVLTFNHRYVLDPVGSITRLPSMRTIRELLSISGTPLPLGQHTHD